MADTDALAGNHCLLQARLPRLHPLCLPPDVRLVHAKGHEPPLHSRTLPVIQLSRLFQPHMHPLQSPTHAWQAFSSDMADALVDNLARSENVRAATAAASAALAAFAAAPGATAAAATAAGPGAKASGAGRPWRPVWLHQSAGEPADAQSTGLDLLPSMAPQQLAPLPPAPGSNTSTVEPPAEPQRPGAPPSAALLPAATAVEPASPAPPGPGAEGPQGRRRRRRLGQRRRMLLAATGGDAPGGHLPNGMAAAGGGNNTEAAGADADELAFSNLFDLSARLRSGAASAEGLRALYGARLRRSVRPRRAGRWLSGVLPK
jgi:hypothetical protein